MNPQQLKLKKATDRNKELEEILSKISSDRIFLNGALNQLEARVIDIRHSGVMAKLRKKAQAALDELSTGRSKYESMKRVEDETG